MPQTHSSSVLLVHLGTVVTGTVSVTHRGPGRGQEQSHVLPHPQRFLACGGTTFCLRRNHELSRKSDLIFVFRYNVGRPVGTSKPPVVSLGGIPFSFSVTRSVPTSPRWLVWEAYHEPTALLVPVSCGLLIIRRGVGLVLYAVFRTVEHHDSTRPVNFQTG